MAGFEIKPTRNKTTELRKKKTLEHKYQTKNRAYLGNLRYHRRCYNIPAVQTFSWGFNFTLLKPRHFGWILQIYLNTPADCETHKTNSAILHSFLLAKLPYTSFRLPRLLARGMDGELIT